MTAVVVAAALAVAAIGLSAATRMGLERELAVTAVRAAVQLTVVGAIVALVFEHAGLAWAFVAVMLGAASFTSGRRMRGTPTRTARATAAIAAGAAAALVPLLATGAFDTAAARARADRRDPDRRRDGRHVGHRPARDRARPRRTARAWRPASRSAPRCPRRSPRPRAAR